MFWQLAKVTYRLSRNSSAQVCSIRPSVSDEVTRSRSSPGFGGSEIKCFGAQPLCAKHRGAGCVGAKTRAVTRKYLHKGKRGDKVGSIACTGALGPAPWPLGHGRPLLGARSLNLFQLETA
jgi:hypothetical protein